MKKLIVLICTVALAWSSTGCSANSSKETPLELEPSTQSMAPSIEAWQVAYAAFLQEFPYLDNNSISSLDGEENYYQFSLRDLDNDGIPELLIFKLQKMDFNQVLTAYTYDETVYELGSYKNPKGSFVSWFRTPANSIFSGIYDCWNGGGQQYCQYLSVQDKKLTCEYLWHRDRSGDLPVLTELSGDTQLIKDSIEAFPDYDSSENFLASYFINKQTIQQVIMG